MELLVRGKVHGSDWSEWFAILITSIFLKGCYLQCILSLGDQKSVIIKVLSMVCGSKERSKQRQSSQDSFNNRALDPASIGWMTEEGGRIIGGNGIGDSFSWEEWLYGWERG